MPDLLLPSLEIQNFRAFEHLRIERLGRVNLITGKNNVGKTSLLEALYLYARDGNPHAIEELLRRRDEVRNHTTSFGFDNKNPDDYDQVSSIKYLFNGRKIITDIRKPILIRPLHAEARELSITVTIEHPGTPVSTPRIQTVSNGKAYEYGVDLITNAAVMSAFPYKVSSESINCRFLKAQILSSTSLSRMWDRIALTIEEDSVLEVLDIIVPGVQRIGFIEGDGDNGERVAMIKTVNMKEPVPLRSLGEGVNRLFGIALSLISARDGILLIDEVETGLHYSVVPDVWRLIFAAAQRLNVQVFATTHSWDCIEAFQRAADEDEHEEAVLVRLRQKNNKLDATVFGERQLAIATRDLIEVR